MNIKLFAGQKKRFQTIIILLLGTYCISSLSTDKLPSLPETNGSVSIPAQEYRYLGSQPRKIKLYIYYPQKKLSNINSQTGLFLTLHNWGGTEASGAPSPTLLANKYNTVCIAVDYLQSGPTTKEPYDFGYLQALDALRALYYVKKELEHNKISFDKQRIYCTGGSGGGNIALMANKLAPRTFACVIDISGMASLTDDIAFNQPGGSRLNARYSQDQDNPYFLEKHMQEIRDTGNPSHLQQMKKYGNSAKLVIIHGTEDNSCLVSDKKRVVENMKKAGFDVDVHYIQKADVDGKIIKGNTHYLGDRTKILLKFAGEYLCENNPKIKTKCKSDFDSADDIKYETSQGAYNISYKAGFPVGQFHPRPDYVAPTVHSPTKELPSNTYTVSEKAFPWYDRIGIWQMVNVPESLIGETPVPQQSCQERNIVLNREAERIVIGMFEKDWEKIKNSYPEITETGLKCKIQSSKGGKTLDYVVLSYPNPPTKSPWRKNDLTAGVILLKIIPGKPTK
ncbi:MAG: DUF2920 family protein [Victivallaceae bacterium]|nr:DUF2920 family protein [Victivallaceae bacterium]